jgi:hypothetical protein
MDASLEAARARRRADDSDWMDHAVRVGLVSYGVVHLLLAWLSLRLAFGDSGGSASSQGALHQLARTQLGLASLYVVAVGFVALAAWQAMEALWGHRDRSGGKRVRKRLSSAGKTVIYGALAASAFKTAIGAGSGGGGTDGVTAKVMALPAGPLLVGLVGVAVIGVAGAIAYRGMSESFRDDMDLDGQLGKDGGTYVLLGKVGHVSKGVAVAIVGALFLFAAFTHDTQKSGGLDQALRKLLDQPFGAPLLVVIALGFACYGLFCFAWARHLDR